MKEWTHDLNVNGEIDGTIERRQLGILRSVVVVVSFPTSGERRGGIHSSRVRDPLWCPVGNLTSA